MERKTVGTIRQADVGAKAINEFGGVLIMEAKGASGGVATIGWCDQHDAYHCSITGNVLGTRMFDLDRLAAMQFVDYITRTEAKRENLT